MKFWKILKITRLFFAKLIFRELRLLWKFTCIFNFLKNKFKKKKHYFLNFYEIVLIFLFLHVLKKFWSFWKIESNFIEFFPFFQISKKKFWFCFKSNLNTFEKVLADQLLKRKNHISVFSNSSHFFPDSVLKWFFENASKCTSPRSRRYSVEPVPFQSCVSSWKVVVVRFDRFSTTSPMCHVSLLSFVTEVDGQPICWLLHTRMSQRMG